MSLQFVCYKLFSSKKSKEIPEAPDDHSIDIGVVRYSPGELQPKTFEAKEEDQRTCEKLMPSFSDEEIAEVAFTEWLLLDKKTQFGGLID